MSSGATFPNGIASFKEHRDIYDDVEAADINKIQAEVVAVQETLGDALTTLTIVQQEIDVLDDELDQTASDEVVTIRFESLKALVLALWDGVNIYAASATVTNKKLPASNQAVAPLAPVNLSTPDSTDDPYQMWNGVGFTVPKSGYWIVEGQVTVKLGANSPTNVGIYAASIGANTEDTKGEDYVYVGDKTQDVLVLKPTFSGWLSKGVKLSLRAQSFNGTPQNVSKARLSVLRVRGG